MSDKQHVGRLADSIDGDDREATHHALQSVMKPRNKTFRGKSDLGDGAVCSTDADHGRMYVLTGGTEWCPHVSHSIRMAER